VAAKQQGADLRTRAIKSLGWLLSFRLGSQVLSWIVTIYIARFLTPADYGIFAMALTVVAGIELLRELGMGSAIIQRKDLTAQHLNTIFWIVAIVSTTLVIVLWVGAELAASFYAEPRLFWVIRILGLNVLFNVVGFIPYSLLTKEIDFRRRSVAAMMGALSSSVVAVILAYQGYGVWALIAGQLTNAAIFNAALVLAARWLPGFQLSFQNMGAILKFGLRLGAVSAIALCSPITNRILVGRFLGGSALGLFTMAEALAEVPHKLSSAVIHQLSLPIFSKLQNEDAELRKYFLKITKYVALATVPAQIGMALVAHDLVVLLLTAEWAPMVTLFQIFCVGNLFHVLSLPPYPLLTARGRAKTLLRLNVAAAVVTAAAIVLAAQINVLAVAIAWLIAFVTFKIALLFLALREMGITGRSYIRNISASLVGTLVMSAAVLTSQSASIGFSQELERLAFEIALGISVYLAIVFWVDTKLAAEIRGIARDMVRPPAPS